MKRAVLAVLVLFAVAGCGDRPNGFSAGSQPEPNAPGATSGEGSVDEDLLWDHTFLLAEADTQDTPLAGTGVSLDFTGDHRVVARASCNTMSGEAAVEGDRLVVGNGLATTEMGCDQDRHAQDEWLDGFLTGSPAIALTGERLTLTAGDGTALELTERSVADPDRPLEGTVWTVDSLVDGETASSTPAGATPATVEFADGRVTVFTGCNGGSGTYRLDGDTITVEPLMLTRKACESGIMTVESAMVAVLTGPVTYDVTSATLALENPSGKGLRLRAE